MARKKAIEKRKARLSEIKIKKKPTQLHIVGEESHEEEPRRGS